MNSTSKMFELKLEDEITTKVNCYEYMHNLNDGIIVAKILADMVKCSLIKKNAARQYIYTKFLGTDQFEPAISKFVELKNG